MATLEELEAQIEDLRAQLNRIAKGDGIKTKGSGLRIGKIRLFQRNISAGDDRLYQEEPDGTQTDLTTAGSGGTRIQDADADTKVQAEESADEDKIRMDTGGTERAVLDSTALALAVPLKADTISEKTGASGVTIDSVLLKDGVVAIGDVAFDDATSDPANTAGSAADGTENSVARKDHVHAVHDISATYVAKALFDADTFLYAAGDNSPAAVSPAQAMAFLSGHAGAAFSFNNENIGSIGRAAIVILDIDSTPANDTCSGTMANFTAGAALTRGDCCYVGSDGKMEKCDADAEATSRCVAIVETATIAEDATGYFLLHGFFEKEFNFGANIGKKVYLDTATAGGVTLTQPSGEDDCIVIVGIVMGDDLLYFNPSVQAIVEHVAP